MFVPLVPGHEQRDTVNASYIKAVIELIRLNEKYQQLDGMSQDPQLALAQVLFRKIAEESCQWVSNTNYNYNSVMFIIITCIIVINNNYNKFAAQ